MPKERIPTTRAASESLILRGRAQAEASRAPVRGLADRRQRLRQGEQAASSLLAGTMGKNRAPASPESKRNGNITPSTTSQDPTNNGAFGNAGQKKINLLNRSAKELEKQGQ